MNLVLKAKIVENFGSQADFASAIDVDESIVSRVVRGRRSLSREDEQKWAEILNVKTKNIFPDRR